MKLHERLTSAWAVTLTLSIVGTGSAQQPPVASGHPDEANRPRVTETGRVAELAPAEDTKVALISLRNADAREMAQSVMKMVAGKYLRVAVDERTNGLLVSAEPATIRQVEEIVKLIDLPASAKAEPVTTQFLTLSKPLQPDLLNTLKMICSDRARISSTENVLAILGKDDDHRAAKDLLARLDDPKSPPDAAGRGLQASFFFLKTQVGGGKPATAKSATEAASALPAGLAAVAAALAESGFQHAQLLAPLTVHMSPGGEKFELHGAAPEIEAIELNGQASASGPDGVELWVKARLSGLVAVDLGDIDGGGKTTVHKVKQIFGVETSVNTKLGDYIVLAATPSPGGSEAIALVVRVTRLK